MKITRQWAMPNRQTFSITPISRLIEHYLGQFDKAVIIDPFANDSPFGHLCMATNDLNPDCPTSHHMESLDFLRLFEPSSVDVVLFDPPYSPRQIAECYQGVGRQVHQKDTQLGFYSERKDAAADLIRPGGYAVCAGWNSNGFGDKRGFDLVEILIVAHGSHHNDTIITVERKRQQPLSRFFTLPVGKS